MFFNSVKEINRPKNEINRLKSKGMATSKTWTGTLGPDPEKPGPGP